MASIYNTATLDTVQHCNSRHWTLHYTTLQQCTNLHTALDCILHYTTPYITEDYGYYNARIVLLFLGKFTIAQVASLDFAGLVK